MVLYKHYLLITEGTMYLYCYEQWNIFHVLHNRLWKLNQVWKQRRDIDLCTLQGYIIWSLLMYIKCPVETYLQPRKLNLTGLNNQFRCIIICYLTLHIKDYQQIARLISIFQNRFQFFIYYLLLFLTQTEFIDTMILKDRFSWHLQNTNMRIKK